LKQLTQTVLPVQIALEWWLCLAVLVDVYPGHGTIHLWYHTVRSTQWLWSGMGV